MAKSRKLAFNVEIFERYKHPDKKRLGTYAIVEDSMCGKHELNEQMFSDFLILVQQDQTGWVDMDNFLVEKEEELKRLRAEKEAMDTFDKYNRSIRDLLVM